MSIGPVGGSGPIDGSGNRVPPINPINPAQNPPNRSPDWGANASGNEGEPPSLDTSSTDNPEAPATKTSTTPSINTKEQALAIIAQYQASLPNEEMRNRELTIENYREIGDACVADLASSPVHADSVNAITIIETVSANLSRLNSAIDFITKTLNPNDQDDAE